MNIREHVQAVRMCSSYSLQLAHSLWWHRFPALSRHLNISEKEKSTINDLWFKSSQTDSHYDINNRNKFAKKGRGWGVLHHLFVSRPPSRKIT